MNIYSLIKTKINQLDFSRAYKLVLKHRKPPHVMVPDIFIFEDKKYIESEIGSEAFIQKYKQDLKKYKKPSKLYVVDVPKRNYGLRPSSFFGFQDRILLFAILCKIAPGIDRKLSKSVYSMRIKHGTSLDFIHDWFKQWCKFESDSLEHVNNGFEYCLEADVSAYFEHIQIDKLVKIILNYIRKYQINHVLLNVLKKILLRWSDNRVGIPQGITEMSYLGNLYLLPLDEAMKSYKGVRYLRYQDNIRVFAKDVNILRKIKQQVWTIELRKLGLNENSKKSTIIKSSDLIDPRQSVINRYSKLGSARSIDSRRVGAALTDLIKLFNYSTGQNTAITSSGRFLDKYYGYSLTRIRKLQDHIDPHTMHRIIRIVLDRLDDFPKKIITTINFLSCFPSDPLIKSELSNYLFSKNNVNLYTEACIFDFFIRSPRVPTDIKRKLLRRCRILLKMNNGNWYTNTKAILLLGLLSSQGRVKKSDLKLVSSLYHKAVPQVKKGILSFFKTVDHFQKYENKSSYRTTIKFLKSNSFINCHFFEPYDLVELDYIDS